MTRREIASRLDVKPGTVNKYFDSAAVKLDCQSQRELTRKYLDARYKVAVLNVNPSTGPAIQEFALGHPEVEDVVGGALVLYQSPGLKGLPKERVSDFVVDAGDWPFPAELRRIADTPMPQIEMGEDGAKWALAAHREPISDMRDRLELYVRPFRYFWARRTNDRLDSAKIFGKTLRQIYWVNALPLGTSPLGNLLVVHVVVTLEHKSGEYVLFTRRRNNPEVVSYERGAWSASFEEQCRGDPRLCPGTRLTAKDQSVMKTAIRGLREELGIEMCDGEWLLSLILEWENGYAGAVVRIHLNLSRHPQLTDLIDVENAWRLKHEDREADSIRLVPFTTDVLIPLVFEGRDPDRWLSPPPDHTFTSLHRTTPVRVLHALMQTDKVRLPELRRIDRTLRRFRPDQRELSF